ncbi:MAG: RecX family transcriptional regulator [Bacteroidales bacterium]|nr:RecX family transcriptional regulator [Bacteroidales bacterium]
MDIAKLVSRLMNQCSRREYCTEDLRPKIRKALGEEWTAASEEEVLERLREGKYLSDLRYATAFAREKSSLNGWGAIKIRYMLSAKRISASDIDAALAEIDSGAAGDRLEKLMTVKYNSIKEEPDAKLKLIRFALGRGYSYDEVGKIADRLCKQ